MTNSHLDASILWTDWNIDFILKINDRRLIFATKPPSPPPPLLSQPNIERECFEFLVSILVKCSLLNSRADFALLFNSSLRQKPVEKVFHFEFVIVFKHFVANQSVSVFDLMIFFGFKNSYFNDIFICVTSCSHDYDVTRRVRLCK